jgi:hypothetical protein
MVELTDIHKDLIANNAQLQFYPLDFTEALTFKWCNSDEYTVFLDPAQLQGMADLKAKLAHECGHCATKATHMMDSPFQLIGRVEHRANRWMFKRYFSLEQFTEALSLGYTTSWELAEWFAMPESLVIQAIHFYKCNMGVDFNKLTNNEFSLDEA